MTEKLPSPAVLEDLRLATELCKLQHRCTELREKLREKKVSRADNSLIRSEICRINEYILGKIRHLEPYFIKYTKRRIYTIYYINNNADTFDSNHRDTDNHNNYIEHDDDHAIEFLQIFYKEKIFKGFIFCNYKGMNNARLKTFLKGAVEKVLLNFNKKIEKIRKAEIHPHDPNGWIDTVKHSDLPDKHFAPKHHKAKRNQADLFTDVALSPATTGGIDPDEESTSHFNSRFTPYEDSVATKLLNQHNEFIRSKLLSEALEFMDEDDVFLINLWMEDKKYDEMSKIFLCRRGGQNNASATFTEDDLKKESVRLRQQLTRCMIKLKIHMSRVLSSRNLLIEDSDQGLLVTDINEKCLNEQVILCTEILNAALELMARRYPVDARSAAIMIKSLSVADRIFHFGKVGDTKLTPKKPHELKILQEFVDYILKERNLEMTIEKLLPLIKKMAVT